MGEGLIGLIGGEAGDEKRCLTMMGAGFIVGGRVGIGGVGGLL